MHMAHLKKKEEEGEGEEEGECIKVVSEINIRLY